MRQSIKRQPKSYLLLFAIFILAMNLRAPITLLGPLTNEIKLDLNMSATVAGLITTLPVLAFAAISPFISRIGNRFGMKNVLFSAVLFFILSERGALTWRNDALFSGDLFLLGWPLRLPTSCYPR